ncbi:MAG TPA: glycosyltransferase 87 family protein [Blastocatellia bacterium]
MMDTATAQRLTVAEPSRRRTIVSAARVPVALFVLGAGSALLYFWARDLHRFTQWIAAYMYLFIAQLAFYALACAVVFRWSESAARIARWATIALVIFFAIIFRAVLVPQRPFLSSDVYRYAWDGYVQTSGINPYRYAPDDPELARLRDSGNFPNISEEDRRWLSPYPPVAQAIFWLVSLARPLNVTALKTAMSAFDLIAGLLLMLVLARNGIDPARAILFAWHPLLIFESAHSGHVEAALIAFLALALLAWSTGKHALTGIALAAATLVKLYPVLLLPAFLVARPIRVSTASGSEPVIEDSTRSSAGFVTRLIHKSNSTLLAGFVATVVLAYAPYLSAGRNLFGFMRGYVEEEGFIESGARYFLLDLVRKLVWVPTNVFLVAAAVCLIAIALWVLMRAKRDAVDLARWSLLTIGAYLLLTTPRYPWYYAWIIPFLCLVPSSGMLYLTCASSLLYLVWYTPFVYPGLPPWLGTAIFGPTLILLALAARTGSRRTRSYP